MESSMERFLSEVLDSIEDYTVVRLIAKGERSFVYEVTMKGKPDVNILIPNVLLVDAIRIKDYTIRKSFTFKLRRY